LSFSQYGNLWECGKSGFRIASPRLISGADLQSIGYVRTHQYCLTTLTDELKRKNGDPRSPDWHRRDGYVGLPLALLFSNERFRVTGFDIAADKVES